MKKKSSEIQATLKLTLDNQIEAGKTIPVLVAVTHNSPDKEYWRDPKAVQGAVKVDRWAPTQCYAVAQTIIDQYGSLYRYADKTPLPSMDFRPEVLEMVDLLLHAFIGREDKLLERAQQAEENRQNKLRKKLLLSPETPLPSSIIADDAVIQIKHTLALALEPYFSKVEAKGAELCSAQSQSQAKDLQIEQLQTENRQLSLQRLALHNDFMKLADFMVKGLHDLEVIKRDKDHRARNQHLPERRLFNFSKPADNKGEQEPAFVDLKLVATYRLEAKELIRRYQTYPDLVRTKKAAND